VSRNPVNLRFDVVDFVLLGFNIEPVVLTVTVAVDVVAIAVEQDLGTFTV
jgi:hypothetical protein